MPQMNAEDRMSRAALIVIGAAVLAVLAGVGVTVWVFWNIASYVYA